MNMINNEEQRHVNNEIQQIDKKANRIKNEDEIKAMKKRLINMK